MVCLVELRNECLNYTLGKTVLSGAKNYVENLEHDFEILCKKRLLHGQLKLNCTKCDKVMQ